PGLSRIAKAAGGIAQERILPNFAHQTFKKWFNQNRNWTNGHENPKVILWADTFSNNFKPQTLMAATEVLEEAGYRVKITQQSLCCGRPLYDFGFLEQAKDMLGEILGGLREDIRSGIPVIGVEPSCVAVFRDELCNLMPNDEDANRLKQQTFTLAEFLMNETESYEVPQLKRKALLHGHCHHQAIMKLNAEEQLLQKMDLDYKKLDSGCCGMAGYFGYEAGEHYEVSIKAGERVLLPAIRSADEDTLIIADGFSCREQIEQETDREAIHIANVLQLALHEEGRLDKHSSAIL
ncbi:MAG TPA: heterodisulfide reductase-related iron-sulfur binding cluster, partial [Fodinibius sp.]|nr:heterodisulfide reductase-related iron-sulfur binding cluster [Fodinibius sp.]